MASWLYSDQAHSMTRGLFVRMHIRHTTDNIKRNCSAYYLIMRMLIGFIISRSDRDRWVRARVYLGDREFWVETTLQRS